MKRAIKPNPHQNKKATFPRTRNNPNSNYSNKHKLKERVDLNPKR